MPLTRAAALDYAKQGIRINAVNPALLRLSCLLVALTVGITADDFASMVPMGRIDRQRKSLKQLFSLL